MARPFRSRYSQTGRGFGSYAAPFIPKPVKRKAARDVNEDDLTPDQQFRQDHFLNEVVFPHFLDAHLTSPRFVHRWGQKRAPAVIHAELQAGLAGMVCHWLAKHTGKDHQPEIGAYSAAVLSKAGNVLARMTYEDLLKQTYGETVANAAPRTRVTALSRPADVQT